MSGEIARLYATIGADTREFQSGLSQARTALNQLGAEVNGAKDKHKDMDGVIGKVGRTVASVGQGYLGLRFIVMDVVRAFGDFIGSGAELQTVMSRIEGLTGTSASAIKGLTADVIGLSTELPKSSKELAEGLYFVASSGFAGQQAMDVLTVSAKASAAGLGETKTVADAVTSTLNAYQMGAGDAAKVTDVLIQAVKEGKGEPAALAGALGRVLPIAAAAGVSFEQVAASLATMTRTGMSAEEAATALRGAIGALEAPGKQAQDALAAMGTSADEVRAAIRDKGLLVALQDLMQRTGGNVEQLDLIIPNIRALTGVLSTAGSQGAAYAAILGKMENAAGSLDKAYEAASNTLEFQTKRFENTANSIKDTLVMGMLPALTDAAVLMNGLIGPTKNATAALDEFRKKGDNANTALLILTRGDDILREAEVATELKVRQSAKTYEEYINTMVGVLRVEDMRAFILRDVENGTKTAAQASQELTELVGGLTQEQFDATRGAYGYGGALDESARAAQRAGDAAKGAATDLGTLGAAAGASKIDLKALKDEADYWMGLVDGPVGEANKSYADGLDGLTTKANDLYNQIRDLETVQGKAVSTQKKGTLTAAELAQAQLKLAAAQAKLAKETDPLKQANLAVEIEKLTGKIGGATGATQDYIDNSKKIGELQKEYQAVQGSIADLATEHDKDIKKIILNILAAKVANGEFGTEGTTLLANLGEKWGLFDKATATAMRGVETAARTLKSGGSMQEVMDLLNGVKDAALGIPTDIGINVHMSGGVSAPNPTGPGGGVAPAPPSSTGGGGSSEVGDTGGGGSCFRAGTPIVLADGTTRPIEEIEVGDQVQSFAMDGTLLPGLVTDLIRDEVNAYYEVALANHAVLRVTGEHPIWAPYLMRDVARVHGQFVRVKDLRAGDLIEAYTPGGRYTQLVTGVRGVAAETPVPVYNFNVAGLHTYIADGVLVHNRKMAAGGQFTVPLGFENDTYPIFASSREQVTVKTPAQQSNGDGVTIHIAPNAFVFNEVLDPRETAAQVSRILGDLADGRRRVN